MQRISSKMGMLAMMAAMMNPQQYGPATRSSNSEILKNPAESYPSKKTNQKKFYFNHHGECYGQPLQMNPCVYECEALNQKNAIRKYNAWKKLQS